MNRKTFLSKTTIVLSLLVFASCDAIFINNGEYTQSEIFDYFCRDIDKYYVFLDYKNIDWENVSQSYLPRVSDDMSDESLFQVLSDLMNELQDGHCNLFAPFAVSRYDFYSSAPANHNKKLIGERYLEDALMTQSIQYGFIRRGESEYGYIYYGSFMNTLYEYELSYAINRFVKANVKGIILDIRDNTGGLILNVYTLVDHFADIERPIYQTYHKVNKTTYEFEETIYCVPKGNSYKGPVALLTNRLCYSASSFAAAAFKAIPHVVQIGDKTGGGMGLPTGGELPNGWEYRISTNVNMDARTESFDQVEYNYESGVPADIMIDMDPDEEAGGIDSIMEAAITNIDSRS